MTTNLNEIMKCSKCGSTDNTPQIKSDDDACFISRLCECGHEAVVQMVPMPKKTTTEMERVMRDFTPLRLF
jgi:hypothetical protein